MRKVCLTLLISLTFNFPAPSLADPVALDATRNGPIRDKWALVIGVSEFQSKKVPKLKYASKDATDFKNFLINEAHFAPDHVRILTDQTATQRKILSELGTKFLARVAKPEDLVLIYFSTHGSPAQADIRGKNFVVAHDSDPDDLFTTGIEMDKITDSIKSRILAQRVVLILDACHSGAVDSGEKGLIRVANFDAEQIAQGSGQMVICSSDTNERSWESKRYPNGVFTKKLLEGLRAKGDRTPLNEVFAYVRRGVADEVQEDYGSKQMPTLRSKWDGADLVLAAPPANPQALPQSVKELLQEDEREARVAATQVAIATPRTQPPRPATATVPTSVKDQIRKGITQYANRDYGSAAATLSYAIAHGGAADADAHYNLAHTYVQLNKIPQAVKEYKECFRLSPNGTRGDYCLKMITYYSQTPSNTARTSPTGSTQVVSPSSPTTSAAVSAGLETESASWPPDDVLNRVRSTMPRIEILRRQTPSYADVMSWSIQDKAAYVNEAAARVEFLSQKLDDAQTTLKRAQSAVGSLVPTRPTYNESNENLQRRKALGRSKADDLLVPYLNDINQKTKLVADENSLLQACETAARTLYGSGFVTTRVTTGTKSNTTTNTKK